MDIKILINNEVIKQVKNSTYLGIITDEHLAWSDQLDLIIKKIVKSAVTISRIRYFTNINSLKLIYYALVNPYLAYGNLIWGNTYKAS